MNSSIRILIAEVTCFTFIVSQTFLPMGLWADEPTIVDTGGSDTSTLSSEPVIPTPLPPVETGTIVPETHPALSDTGKAKLSGSGQTETGIAEIVVTTNTSDTGSSIIEIAQSKVPPAVSSDESVEPMRRNERQNMQIASSTPRDQILVEFKPETVDVESTDGKTLVDAVAEAHGMTTTETLGDQNIAVMALPADTGSNQSVMTPSIEFTTTLEHDAQIDETISTLKQDPRVQHVQKNFVYKLLDVSSKSKVLSKKFVPLSYTGRSLPNDGSFSNLWGLDNQGQSVNSITGTIDADIDYPEAMAYASGRFTATGTIVAVLDTGVDYMHPDLAANMWDGTNCFSDTGMYIGGCMHGYDFAYDDMDPLDHFGHGTHVAGTIGAVANNGTGVTGIAPHVQIMAVKVLNDGGFGSTSDIIRGINFARNNGARVINASFGGSDSSTTYSDFDFLMYNAIQDFPGLFVAAAGNEASDNNIYRTIPAGYGSDIMVSGEAIVDREIVLSGSVLIPALQNVIAVAATDSNDQLSSFSNYGTGSVHIAAPGENIYSTFFEENYVSGEAVAISYANGWVKKVGAAPETWAKRSNIVISGSTVDLSGALWGDTRNPYVSGESSYIQKSIPNDAKNIADISLTAWCDTPAYYDSNDRIDILISTGGLFTKFDSIDASSLHYYSDNGQDFEIDGHLGSYGAYPLSYRVMDAINASQNFEMRLKWITTGSGTNNYGCLLKDIAINHTKRTDGYAYLDGTSMATPHVAGAAAFAQSINPDLSPWELKNIIMNTGDYTPSLIDKVQSVRRLNLLNLLSAVVHPTFLSQRYVLSGESTVKIFGEGKDYTAVFSTISKTPYFYGESGYYIEAATLAQAGAIPSSPTESGYDLSNTMARWEIAPIAAKLGGYTPTSCRGDVFADVNRTMTGGVRACGAIEALANAGVIDTRLAHFSPDTMIDTSEALVIILKSLGYTPSLVDNGFTNLGDLSSTTRGYINRAYELSLIPGPGYFDPHVYNPRGAIYNWFVFILGLPDVTDTRISGVNREDSASGIVFEHLSPDTEYYYTISFQGQWFQDDHASYVYSFHTPKVVTQTLTGSVIVSGETYVNNASSTGVIFTGSSASGKIILVNNATNVSVEIPTQNLKIITASGTWDGVLHAAETYTGSNVVTTSSGGITASRIEIIGSPVASLALSGQLATVTIPVVAQSGTTIPIYRADSIGQVFVYIATCTVRNNLCTFTTNHFSAFALGAMTVPSSGGSVGGGTPITSGSSGGGGGSSLVGNSIFSSKSVMNDLLTSRTLQVGNTLSTMQITPLTAQVTAPSINFRKREATLAWVGNLIEGQTISEAADAIGAEISKSRSMIRQLISYDLIINYLGRKIQTGDAFDTPAYIKLRDTLQNQRSSLIMMPYTSR